MCFFFIKKCIFSSMSCFFFLLFFSWKLLYEDWDYWWNVTLWLGGFFFWWLLFCFWLLKLSKLWCVFFLFFFFCKRMCSKVYLSLQNCRFVDWLTFHFKLVDLLVKLFEWKQFFSTVQLFLFKYFFWGFSQMFENIFKHSLKISTFNENFETVCSSSAKTLFWALRVKIIFSWKSALMVKSTSMNFSLFFQIFFGRGDSFLSENYVSFILKGDLIFSK